MSDDSKSTTYEEDHALAAGPTYGLELILRTHSKIIKTRSDLVVVWLHWCLLRNGFNNHGGEFTHSDYHSEALPVNLCWNGDKGAYILKYEFGGVPIALGLYLDPLQFNTANVSFVGLFRTLRMQLMISDIVDDDFQIRGDMIDEMTKVIDEEFVKPMVPPKLVRKKRLDSAMRWRSRSQSGVSADDVAAV